MSTTPYHLHARMRHRMTRYSPNGVDIIEECADCGARFLHNPCIDYPVTLDPCRRTARAWWAWATGAAPALTTREVQVD